MAGSNIFSDILKNMADIKRLADTAPDEIGRALMEVANELVPECQAVTPVGDRHYGDHEPGTLRDEIHAEGPFQQGKLITAKIVTGPLSKSYALIQHEDMDLLHTEGDAKFIERPLGKASRYISDRVAKKIQIAKLIKGAS
jgi:hypothetical protein